MYRYSDHKSTFPIADPTRPTFHAHNFLIAKKKDGSTEDRPMYVCREPVGFKGVPPETDNVKVMSFNILSCGIVPSAIIHSTPCGSVNESMSAEHQEKRFCQTLEIIESHMKTNHVICLQEATFQTRMNPALHCLLDKYGYTQIMTNYGSYNKGKTTYMGFLGVGVLIPPSYKLVDFKVPGYTEVPRFEDRRMAIAVLKDNKGRVFGAGSVHVPCKHDNRDLMRQFVTDVASTMEAHCPSMPYFIAGDWNMNHWDCNELAPFGLKKVHESTPTQFTCFSCKLDDNMNPVCNFYLLDYIVYKKFKSAVATELTTIPTDAHYCIPNGSFPSDHLPIEATFTLGAPKLPDGLEALTESLLSLAKR
jgi:endonuclease/exonuclease/phosphatase family metal-dependent hydrolase